MLTTTKNAYLGVFRAKLGMLVRLHMPPPARRKVRRQEARSASFTEGRRQPGEKCPPESGRQPADNCAVDIPGLGD